MALLKRKRTGLGDAMEVVTRFVNACNRHDADGVYACLHPDFDSIQPMYPSRNFRGADQVRRNWQAIFDAEPGFRLTVLRSAAVDDTIWLELHGAGRDAEVAGVFVMGVQGDRIRWARIYSALVEPVPAGVVDEPATGLREVPPYQEEGTAAAPAAPADGGEVVEESLIAPVLDMERSGRRRRRSRHAASDDAGAAPQEPAADDDITVVHADAASVDVSDADAVVMIDAGPDVDVTVEVEPGTEVVVVTNDPPPPAADETPPPAADETPPPAADETPPPAADETDGPPTEAVDVVAFIEDEPPSEPVPELAPEPELMADEPPVWDAPPAEPAADRDPDPDPDQHREPPRRLFGRKRP